MIKMYVTYPAPDSRNTKLEVLGFLKSQLVKTKESKEKRKKREEWS